MVLYYNTLNKDLKKEIRSKSISDEELKEISEKMRLENKKKQKVMNIVMISIFVLFIIMAITMVIREENFVMNINILLMPIVLFAIIYGIVYISQFGIIKLQFNRIIKKYYPDIADEIKL